MKLNSKSPSKRPASLQPLPLAVYLTGAVGSTFLVSAPQAEAAVTSVTFGFGSVLNSGTSYSQFQTTPYFGKLTAMNINNNVLLGTFSSGGSVYNQNEREYYGLKTGTLSFFASGTVIGNGNNGPLGRAYLSSRYFPEFRITTDQLNQNLGFRTSTNNWGWANVSWNATAKALTINSAYVESVVGNTITVGDIGAVPEPSRALLALACLGAAALRRRRKQAA
jgi:MYXO-CTERM domain-containing protein